MIARILAALAFAAFSPSAQIVTIPSSGPAGRWVQVIPVAPSYFSSGSFISTQSGNINAPATYGFTGAAVCHVNVPCGTSLTGAGDQLILGNLAHTVTVPAGAWSVGSSPATATGTLAISASSYTAAANLTVTAGATLTVMGSVEMPNGTWTNNGTINIDASWSTAPTTAAYFWITNESNSAGGGLFVNNGTFFGAANSAANVACNSNACRSGTFGNDNTGSFGNANAGWINCTAGAFSYVGQAANGSIAMDWNLSSENRSLTGCNFDHMQTLQVVEAGRSGTVTCSGCSFTNPMSTSGSSTQGTISWQSAGAPSAACAFSNSIIEGAFYYNNYGATAGATNLNCTFTNVDLEVSPNYPALGFLTTQNSTAAVDQMLWYVQPFDAISDPQGETPTNSTLSRSVIAEYANLNQNSISNNNLHPMVVTPGANATTIQTWFIEGSNTTANSDFLQIGGQPASAQTLEIKNTVQSCNQYGYALGSFINIDTGSTVNTLRLDVDNDTVCGSGLNPATDSNVIGIGAETVTLTSGTIPHIYSTLFYQDTSTFGTMEAVCGTPTAAPAGTITAFDYNAAYFNSISGGSYLCSGSGSIGASFTPGSHSINPSTSRGPAWTAASNAIYPNNVGRLVNFDQYLCTTQSVTAACFSGSSTAWASGTSYSTAGQIVSDQQSTVWSNATFYWRRINGAGCTALASSANRPLTGTAWTLCWEPAVMSYVRSAVLAGTTYSFTQTSATGLGVIGLLNAWEIYGMKPTGTDATALATAGFGGTYIGAVALP